MKNRLGSYPEKASHIMTNSYYKNKSVEKTIRLLELLSEEGEMSLAQVSSKLHLNRSTCHRFLLNLHELGYVEQNQLLQYRLSFRVYELGMKVADRLQVRQMAFPFLRQLSTAFNETINLGYWNNGKILHLDKINSTEALRIDPGIGATMMNNSSEINLSIPI